MNKQSPELGRAALFDVYRPGPVAFSHGEGSWLFDRDGKRYLDFSTGIAVSALGHAHPRLVEALREQGSRLWHVSNLYPIPEQARLGELLTHRSCAEKVFFCNSGTEALEGLLKTARTFHASQGDQERVEIIGFEGSFHGRTLAAWAAAGKEAVGYGPLPVGFRQVPFGNVNALRDAMSSKTAAILLEPIQGEGGIRVPPDGFLAAVRAAADEFGCLVALDEVQCGVGRTGRFWAHEAMSLRPDLWMAAKGLGCGFPIGAVLAGPGVSVGMQPGVHGSTFGGNPLAMAVGCAVVEEIDRPEFLQAIGERGEQLRLGLNALVDRFPSLLSEVRGLGLMRGLVFVDPTYGLRELVWNFMDAGLLTVPSSGGTLRLLPPLNVSEEEVAEALRILEKVITLKS